MDRKTKLTNRIYESLKKEAEEERIEVVRNSTGNKFKIPGLTEFVERLKGKTYRCYPTKLVLGDKTISPDVNLSDGSFFTKFKDFTKAYFSKTGDKGLLYIVFSVEPDFKKYLIESEDEVVYGDDSYMEISCRLKGFEFERAHCSKDTFTIIFKKK